MFLIRVGNPNTMMYRQTTVTSSLSPLSSHHCHEIQQTPTTVVRIHICQSRPPLSLLSPPSPLSPLTVTTHCHHSLSPLTVTTHCHHREYHCHHLQIHCNHSPRWFKRTQSILRCKTKNTNRRGPTDGWTVTIVTVPMISAITMPPYHPVKPALPRSEVVAQEPNHCPPDNFRPRSPTCVSYP
jgi:hypothetical protein